MHAFIIRPFGTKNGIDFDRVEEKLIRPALDRLGFSGGTTGELVEQGNIRTDMFEQLLIADLIIADISIHNANVFYELGIRHSFRDKRTFLIKSTGDDVPFDIKTDRYMGYDAENPAASLEGLADALRRTWLSEQKDSPVFQLLPDLESTDPSRFILVPLDFHEEVRSAEQAGDCGHLQLLAVEVNGFSWKAKGLRLIGKAQVNLKDFQGAKITWEDILEYDTMDLEVNTMLGTIYQRLGDLTKSTQALERVLQNNTISKKDKAEAWALLARNAKTLWEKRWQEKKGSDAIQRTALTSPHLSASFSLYKRGFTVDRNHFYSGLNALAMVTIIIELANVQPQSWSDQFDEEEEAALELKKLQKVRADLTVGVKLAIESEEKDLYCQNRTDIWAEISGADLLLLSSKKPRRVAYAYKKVLDGAPDFVLDSARNQILLYNRLGILTENTEAALDVIPSAKEKKNETQQAPPHVILFTGHRLDAKDRTTPRFPPASEAQARSMIKEAVVLEKDKVGGQVVGISGGASGGDILFHEVCAELGIPTTMYLAIPKEKYIVASVADGGPDWVERFKSLCRKKQPVTLLESRELPRWLQFKPDYSIWERSNLWMLYKALDISQDNITLVALWNGEEGDGPGGTKDMVERAQARGAKFLRLDARELLA